MTFLSIDSETECFAPGYRAPDAVCWTWDSPTLQRKIEHADSAEPALRAFLKGQYVIVGQNTAYDTVVACENYPDLIPLIFQAYDDDRITCTKIREQLIDIALGRFRVEYDADGEATARGYGLFDMARRYLGKTLDKDTWRMRYGELKKLPIIAWPAGAIEYAIGDAVDTRAIAEIQEQRKDLLSDQFRQARAQFALALTMTRGLKTDPAKVEEFAAIAEARYDELKAYLVENGLVRPDRTKRDGTIEPGAADTEAARAAMAEACAEEGIAPLMTKGGKKSIEEGGKGPQISLGADACDRVTDPLIQAYSNFQTARKVMSNDVALLREASVICCHPEYGITKTSRTTCSRPNIQALRKAKGIRDCFIPEDGYVYLQCDYPSLELYTIAEYCMRAFGFSALGATLKADKDAHLMLAATFLGRTYDEILPLKKHDPEVKAARQAAKAVNFGLPGGLGAKRLTELAKKDYGVVMTIEEAKERTKLWKKTYPEMVQHLNSVSELTKDEGVGGEVSLFTGQKTAKKTYCELANERFQRLGADIAKEALYNVAKLCFVGVGPLRGAYPVAFIHDEIIVECPIANFRPAAKLLALTMCTAANKYLVNVPMKLTGDVRLEAQAMAYWSKDAEPVYNEKGELEIWGQK